MIYEIVSHHDSDVSTFNYGEQREQSNQQTDVVVQQD